MGEVTKIAWTDHTFNPWIGCTKVSAGCYHCYAAAQDQRWKGGVHWGPGAPRQVTSPENWKLPLRWNESAKFRGVRERVFCASLADVFDDEAPYGARDWLWELIFRTPNLDWQLLTKRPQNVVRMLPSFFHAPHSNVWIGTTVEDQKAADERIPELLRIPAVVRFLSVEPMLGPVDLERPMPGPDLDNGRICQPWYIQSGIDWVIVGGESGGHARPMDLRWARSIVAQCKAAGVACFVKQLGAAPVTDANGGLSRTRRLSIVDPKGGDPSEWPEDLRIREFPEVRHAA